jgi:hypothetical protein
MGATLARRRSAERPERTGYEISKQDAAASQLATAIWLWANSWDPVSVHVLASAAAEVVGVLRRTNGTPPVDSEILSSLASEFDEVFEDYLKTSFNFMKHGARDPSAKLRFNPNESEWVIYHACVDYLATFEVAPPEASLFLVYMTDHWPWLVRKEATDPVRTLREQLRRNAKGDKVSREDVATSLMNLHRFAAHLRDTDQHDHPLIRNV